MGIISKKNTNIVLMCETVGIPQENTKRIIPANLNEI